MLKTRVSISEQGREPTRPSKVKSDQKDVKTYKTQTETELMVMTTGQGAREGARQARFLRALQEKPG